jgi:3-polyprenyl-4-hydroxybenzoate decarboxylase
LGLTRENQAPLLFENIKDYPDQRVFTNGLCDTASINLALGMEFGTTRKALIAEGKKRMGTLSNRDSSRLALRWRTLLE